MGKEATKSFEKDPGVYRRWSVARRTELSLADIAATPYRVRLEMLKLPPMWDKKPGVGEWWERVKARSTRLVKLSGHFEDDLGH